MRLFSIRGGMRTGKDTVGKMISTILFFNWFSLDEAWAQYNIMPYSDYIKKWAGTLKKGLELDFPYEFNVVLWENSGDAYRNEIMPSLEISRRAALQMRGQKMREIHPDYWINAAMQNMGMTTVITDTRFPNELEKVFEAGGTSIVMERTMDQRFPAEWAEYLKTDYVKSIVTANTKGIDESFIYLFLKINYPKLHEALNDISETALNGYVTDKEEVTLYNTGTEKDLFTTVYDIIKLRENGNI